MDALVDFTQSLPTWLQWLGVMLAGAIPFVESHFAALIGGVAGVPLPLAVAAAAVGNAVSVALVVTIGGGVRDRVRARRTAAIATEAAPGAAEPSLRRQRFQRLFGRFGVPGVGLVGQMFVPNQFTAAMMLALGASRRAVIVWSFAGIALWAVVFALLGRAGLMALGG